MLGFIAAAFPPAFVAKLSVVILAAVVLVLGVAAGQLRRVRSTGRLGRGAINAWAFLIGVCPIYLPFKFGPLPGLNPNRVCFWFVVAVSVLSYVNCHEFRERLSRRVRQFGFVFKVLVFL